MEKVQNALLSFLKQFEPNQTFLIAYSGGMDSTLLLALSNHISLVSDYQFRVLHLNHGISPFSDDWAMHCQAVCHQYQMPFISKKINLERSKGVSLENAARIARYQFFAEHLSEGEVLLTAHHAEDQAETFLLQALRGAGPKGLASMAPLKSFAKGFHGRPFLTIDRNSIQAAVKDLSLKYIDDDSNSSEDFSRNFLRLNVMPVLKSRWPGLSVALSRSASLCADSQKLLDEITTDRLQAYTGIEVNTLSVSKLRTISNEMQRLVLRKWIEQNNHPIPTLKKLLTVQEQMLSASEDRFPCVDWEEVEVRRFKDDIYIMKRLEPLPDNIHLTWDLNGTLYLPNNLGCLKTSLVKGEGINLNVSKVRVSFRQGGEKIQVANVGYRPLKKIFQEKNVPHWYRSKYPYLYAGDNLIAVVGLISDAKYEVRKEEIGRKIEWVKV